jgi:FkbM family methyltransferase
VKNGIIFNLTKDVKNKFNSLFTNKYSELGISWSELKRIRSLPTDRINSTIIKSHQFYFRDSNELLHAIDEIFLQELYKINFDKASPLIIDCGAHIGVSVLYLKIKYPDAEIIAFEPDSINFDILSKNVANSNFNHISLRKEAVWIETTELNFISDGNMSSKIATDTENGNQSLTNAVRLKDLLNRKVDFLKLDVEGAEYQIIEDIKEELNWVDYLFIEYHGSFRQNDELNRLLQIVSNAGFRYYIKEANLCYETPFARANKKPEYDIQLNLYCFRNSVD